MFRLSRYYSIASLIGIAAVIIALSLISRQLAMKNLMGYQTRANVDLTNSFANSIWGEFSSFVDLSMTFSSVDELKQRLELEKLNSVTKEQMKGTNVVKVKIYNLKGLTVFSTDPKQIGEDKSKNPGFLQARSGLVASEITFRNEFYAFEQVIVNRDLVASYIPIREDIGKPVTAVFEVYSDVTPLVDDMDNTQNYIIAGVFTSLSLLYLFLFLIVKRADYILIQQELERKMNEDNIRHQAYHDSLTGLPNRDNFLECMEEAIKRAKRLKKNGALMFLDLDRFKLVNDSLGHDAGDQLLRITATRIQKSLRETDMAFRMSGDEFVVIMEGLGKGENGSQPARRILDAMAIPVALNGHEVIVNISIGITTFPKLAANIDTLVKEADSAMYRAKQSGQSQFGFFSSDMSMADSQRLTMETDLQNALRNDEFVIYYQPKIDTNTREFTGVEALLRWQHPTKGLILPNDFISLLEDTGLIYQVGDWVLVTACQQVQDWITAGLQPLRISVNISLKQFRNGNLIDSIHRALETSGLDPKYLELELTERMLVENTEYAITVMHDLKKQGVTLSIDDFGSSYSALSYLKKFPVDYLKIDRSFIKDLEVNDKDEAVTTAIVSLAKSLTLGIVAEGVETEHQANILREKGCHELQGFLFSKPIPGNELEDKLLQTQVGEAD